MKQPQKSFTFLLALLLAAILTIMLWQSRPDIAQQRQTGLNDALISAAEQNDVAAIRALLHAGASPNACEQPSSAWERIERDHPAVAHLAVRFHRSDGIPIYDTALEAAIRQGQAKAVAALLVRGANVQQRDNFGETALDVSETEVSGSDQTTAVTNKKIFLMLKKAGAKHRAGVENF